MSNEKKPISEMCPLCQDWAGKNINLKLCERCRLQSVLMYDMITINVGTEEDPIFIPLKEIIERKID